MQTGFAFTKLADRLASIAELAADDFDLLAKMPCTIGHFASHDRILPTPEQASRCCLLLRGYLCCRDEPNGQITSIYVPGDVPDLYSVSPPMLDADLTALGPVVVAFVPHTFVCEITSLSARLQHAFRLLHLIDMSRLRNWIVNVGSRDSLARVAHLICEITWRLRAVGIATDYRFPSPFTQSDLAAACAISAVHANRIIQELRRRRILHWQSRVVTILDPETLALLGDFNPDYLGFRSPAGASSQPRRSSATPEASRLPALQ